jgi:hypothetical protein
MTPYQRGHQDAYEQGLTQILARLDRLENLLVVDLLAALAGLKLEREMKQSTQDLIDTVTALQTDVGTATTAIDALVAAQDSGDDDAVEAQVAILKGIGPNLKSHLPNIAQAAQTVAQAPADPDANVSAAVSGS